MEDGSASSPAGTDKTADETVSPFDLVLKRLDELSVCQCAVKRHTKVYRMVIVGKGSTVHRDIKMALDVLVVKVKTVVVVFAVLNFSLQRSRYWCEPACPCVEHHLHSLPGSICSEQCQIIGIAVLLRCCLWEVADVDIEQHGREG